MKTILLLIATAILGVVPLTAAPKTLLGGVMNKGKTEGCAMALRNLAPLFGMYADNHNGAYPAKDNIEGFKELMKTGSVQLQCPGKTFPNKERASQPSADKIKEEDSDYIYIGGMSYFLQKPAEIPFVFDKPGNNHINVLFGDGHVETLNAQDGYNSCAEVIAQLNKIKQYDANTLRFLNDKATAIDKALGYDKKEEEKKK